MNEHPYCIVCGKAVDSWGQACSDEHAKMFQYKLTKPPIGIMPRRIWIENRLDDLRRAIIEYTSALLPVKEEWVQEYIQLLRELNL